ncbi:NAD-dependent epimerase/dehydratase family protein [bacterium]|nr:NAD-dependent epimerase/dehydratase family protein [bacterium]
MKILVTGSEGFIGSNLCVWLRHKPDVEVLGFDRDHTQAELRNALQSADCIVHLAGVNRPQSVEEFQTGNVDLTAAICQQLIEQKRSVPILFSSSIQVELDNPYAESKRQAETVLSEYARQSGARVVIFRFSNLFGKWCRPNYNSVVATFCHNIANGIPITISDPNRAIDFVHVDDAIQSLWHEISRCTMGDQPKEAVEQVVFRNAEPRYTVTLGELAALLQSFLCSRETLILPDFSNPFVHKLYGTFLSYLGQDAFAYNLLQRSDPRGALAEFVKSASFGQIFVSRTNPGVTRGNHYHHAKTEKFLVLEGEAVIRFRHIKSDDVSEYKVRGKDFRVVDIPPGYTHSIENVGASELITLFWASEIFDAQRPDTVWEEVLT